MAQGLRALGHNCYGRYGNGNNYLVPHVEQPYDVLIMCHEGEFVNDEPDKPIVLLWGADIGAITTEQQQSLLERLRFKVAFVRDLLPGVRLKRPVYPINFGVEDRYYCATGVFRKDLAQRSIDVFFCGRYEGYKNRELLIELCKNRLPASLNVIMDGHRYCAPDDQWSLTVNGHCHHVPDYFKALADSKIILSPGGAGPDCARHWEAFASGGIPLIEDMKTQQCLPLTSGEGCLLYSSPWDALDKITDVLAKPRIAQKIADDAFELSRRHTCMERAKYFVSKLKKARINIS